MPPTRDQEEPRTPLPPPGLLTVRAAVVLLIGGMLGALVGCLSYVETPSPARAIMSGVVVSLMALHPLNRLIGQ
jgi:uncharacterized membrane protein YfcA